MPLHYYDAGAGVWRESEEFYPRDANEWKLRRDGWVYDETAGRWRRFSQKTVDIVLSTDAAEVLVSPSTYPAESQDLLSGDTVRVFVPAGVTLYGQSGTGVDALRVQDFPAGVRWIIEIDGDVAGSAGRAGDGGDGDGENNARPGGDGIDGGTALYVGFDADGNFPDASLVGTGRIGGGGGGGAGGGANEIVAGGGGGGAGSLHVPSQGGDGGFGRGSGGNNSFPGSPGADGSGTNGGSGGNGHPLAPLLFDRGRHDGRGGNGGDGGDVGQPGQAGTSGYSQGSNFPPHIASGGTGGDAGYAIIGYSRINNPGDFSGQLFGPTI